MAADIIFVVFQGDPRKKIMECFLGGVPHKNPNFFG